MEGAIKNYVAFLGRAIVGVVAIFILSIGFGVVSAPRARAYAIGSLSSASSAGIAVGSYDFGSSLQNLISPFTGFINSLRFNGSTTINSGGQTPAAPNINMAPVMESGLENTVTAWLGDFNNWFFGVTGIRLSGIFYVLLSAISWVLGLAQQAVSWLLGLFH